MIRALVIAALPALVAATPVELTVHVAVEADGDPAVDADWINAAIEVATARLGGAEVAFAQAGASGEDVPVDIDTVEQRDALAALAGGGRLHVFVVRRLADKDTSGDRINGVTWRYAGADRALRGRRYIVVARDAQKDTLAHELGHFFGLAHATDPSNLMTAPGRRSGAGLDAVQLEKIRRRVTAWTRRRAPAHTGRGDRER